MTVREDLENSYIDMDAEDFGNILKLCHHPGVQARSLKAVSYLNDCVKMEARHRTQLATKPSMLPDWTTFNDLDVSDFYMCAIVIDRACEADDCGQLSFWAKNLLSCVSLEMATRLTLRHTVTAALAKALKDQPEDTGEPEAD